MILVFVAPVVTACRIMAIMSVLLLYFICSLLRIQSYVLFKTTVRFFHNNISPFNMVRARSSLALPRHSAIRQGSVQLDGFDVYLEAVNQLSSDLAYRRRLLDESALVELRKRLLELLSIRLKRSEEPHPHLAVALLYLTIELKAVHLGHPDVENGEVVRIRPECLKRLLRVLEGVDRMTAQLQALLECVDNVRFVVDEQNLQ